MNCPRDNTALEMKSFGEVSAATCPTCRGMYLQHGELNRLAEPTVGDVEYSSVDGDTLQHPDEYGPIRCPHDGATMSKVDFNVDTTIILDYCTTCEGFWVDEKELDAIRAEVKRLNEADAEVPDSWLVRLSRIVWQLPLPH
jgi:Zn-finger nucleic acid-binding protein